VTGIRRLNHAVLFVSDVERAVDFYRQVLGFGVAATEPRMNAVFMKAPDSANHHDLGLFGLGPAASPPEPGRIGLYHLAWQVDTVDQLVSLRAALISSGNYTGESSHGATKSVYGADPDGNEFEIMWMLPRAEWGSMEHAATVERLDLDAEMGRWSGVGTADELGAG